MLIELLEQGKEIHAGTRPVRVRQVLHVLENSLVKVMRRSYVWLAVCTKAVDAGRRTGDRIVRRRIKLAGMVAKCAIYLGETHPVSELPKGWERGGLYYGYDAVDEYARDSGYPGSRSSLAFYALLESKKLI